MSATTSVLEASGQLERGSKWFDDGSLVLAAGNTMFRVHASLLSQCSTVFKDMFSVPQLPNSTSPEAMVEGCPVVHLHDSPEDVECILNAIYEYPYSNDAASPITPMKFSMVSAFLRLGNKYDIPHLRDHAVSRLRNEYPFAYSPESPYKLRGYLELYKGRAFDVSCLAYNEGIFSLLPITLHLITSSLTTKEILDGFTRPDGTKAVLPQPLLYACILGKEKLRKVMCTESYKFLTQPTPPYCAQHTRCLESMRYLAKEIWQPFPDLRYALCYTWHMIRVDLASRDVKFCDDFSKKLSVLHQEGRKMVWEALPDIFGFQSWEEVKRMDPVESRFKFKELQTVIEHRMTESILSV
ncbi:hypothetical protein BJ165DRAFT_1563754 [Panaeolus papilionaceus]|nr:hypothetical protein BJ165DRAFT_1563754 [Panaeolus papilionaceus]